ncbi:MAG: PAS domain-containing protein [Gemmatimonadota bacterium]
MTPPVEIILARQLAGYLAVPVFVVSPEGDLLFYNEPAERILGTRFEETGRMAMEEWATVFQPTDEQGIPLPPEDLPLVATLEKREPAMRSFFIRGLDGELRRIMTVSIPLLAQGKRFLGGMAMFWEVR